MQHFRRFGKWILLLFVVLELGHLVHVAVADPSKPVPEFFEALQDVPLMPGLVELDEPSFSFDKPEGGITEGVARIDGAGRDQVLQFYQATLPQFGWGKVNASEYYRHNEHLEITFEHEQQSEIVRIMIRPSR